MKVNSKLLSLLEDDDATMEIEFSSATEGKIFCGGQEFAVKFGESQPTEVYRRLPAGDDADYELLGFADRRFHVISSLDVVTQDMRRKARDDLVEKQKHQAIQLPLDGAAAAATGHDVVRRKRSIGVLLPEPPPPPLSASSSSSSAASPPKGTRGATVLAKKPFAVAIEAPSTWVVLHDLPASVTAVDVRAFFRGLHIKGAYIFYASPTSGAAFAAAATAADVYVDFETKAGAEQAAARCGERMTFRADPRRRSVGSGVGTGLVQAQTPSRGPLAADVRPVASAEASWAKALGIRLEDTAARCEEALMAVRRHLPGALQGLRPAAAHARWDALFGGAAGAPVPPPDEIVAHHEHQRMLGSSSHVYRHDYSPVGGFFDPPFALAWAGGYGMTLALAARPPAGALCPPGVPTYGTGTAGPLHGDATLHPAYVEVEDTLGQLGAVLCAAVVGGNGGSRTGAGADATEVAEEEQRAQLVVCDTVHRMIGIYQHLHHDLMKRRFS